MRAMSRKPLATKNHRRLKSQFPSSHRQPPPKILTTPFVTLQRSPNCSCAGGCPRCAPLQAKLKIGKPNDKHEQEADRVAEQVMQMPDDAIQPTPLATQTSPLVKRQEEPEEEEDEIVQSKGRSGLTSNTSAEVQRSIRSLRGSGEPLAPELRSFFEPRLGRDLCGVRIHNNGRAAKMAGAIDARAFTFGKDIVFGAGNYAPESTQGKSLLAHELAHVIQQDGNQNKSQVLQRAPTCGDVSVCIPTPAGYPLIYYWSGGKNDRNCGMPVGYAQRLLKQFFLSGGINACEDLHRKLRIQRGGPLPQDATRMFYIDSGKRNAPAMKQHCLFDLTTRAVTLGFQAAVFEEPKEWDGKIGNRTWSALEDYLSEKRGKGRCPFRYAFGLTPSNALKIENITGPSPGNCGNVMGEYFWRLIKESKQGGFIIQHVVKRITVKDRNNKDITLQKTRKRKWDYYEAWEVNPGEKSTHEKPETSFNADAYWCRPMGSGTHGEVTIDGKAIFYEGLPSLPPDFVRNNPETLAGILRSSENDPGLFGGTYPIDHNLHFRWDCRKKIRKSEIYHEIPRQP